jgi:hypothetical protein
VKRSEIYREAAKRMAERGPFGEDGEERYSCDQIWMSSPFGAFDLREEYSELFRPDPTSRSCFWLNSSLRPYERHEWRLTALCFMAAIAEDEERSAK